MLLQVMSWEEKARMLSKVWIAGIVIALISVAVYLWIQYKKRKRQEERFIKRGMQSKASVPGKVEFNIHTNQNVTKLQAKRLSELLAEFSVESNRRKLVIRSFKLYPAADAKTDNWLCGQVKLWAQKSGYSSIEYKVQNTETKLVDLLKSQGFKEVKLSRDEAAQGAYMLKFSC